MNPLLEVKNLSVSFETREGKLPAVDGLSLAVNTNETLAIVGESGSGKSVAMYALMGLLPSTATTGKQSFARFNSIDILAASNIKKLRGKRIAMIFQDPMTCLNPYLTLGTQLTEPLLIHDKLGKVAATRRAAEALTEVGISDAHSRLKQYPHQLSGGLRQRVMIAMALITKPELLIADEPTTALDVTVQAQILDLIARLKTERGTSCIFITHDLSVVSDIADRVVVMYAGRAIEVADVGQIYGDPKHPYTLGLLASMPAVHKRGESLYSIPGLPPDLRNPISGCPFAPRCEKRIDSCSATVPNLSEISPAHTSACLRVQRGEV